ncbi:MAG TPA: HAMP domain-containing sensor histidine kinase, partial [Burkholderiaceae bacterium]|nr:HAMP domain-containing sensor histidine kinase [Burkholderiaceae bacterium]
MSWQSGDAPPGSGEVAARIRSDPDTVTGSLGPIDRWPQCLRTTLGNALESPLPIAILWGPAHALLCNDAFRPFLPNQDLDALGRPAADALAGQWPCLRELCERVLSTATPIVAREHPLRRTDSGQRWSLCCSVLRDDAGAAGGVMLTLLETAAPATDTPGREAERHQRFLLALEDALRPIRAPDEIMRVVSARLGEYLDVNRCAYAAMEVDQDHFTLTSGFSRDGMSINGRFRLSWFSAAAAAAMRAGDVFVIEDVEREPRLAPSEAANCIARNVRSGVWVPLHKDGVLVAGLAVNHSAPRAWQPDEVDLVRQVVNRCWEAIERAHAELELARQQQHLLEADRRKDEFLAMLSHELRNPLAPLTNALRLLSRSASLDEKDRAAVAMAERQTRQLARLVDDLLEAARITSGKIALHPERIELAPIVSAAAEAMRRTSEARAQRLEILLPAEPIRLTADPVRVAQIVENLLTNASKYTPDGGTIRVEVRTLPQQVELNVIDDGIGIEPHELAHLFSLFSQIPRTVKR